MIPGLRTYFKDHYAQIRALLHTRMQSRSFKYRRNVLIIALGFVIGLASLTFSSYLASQLREKEQNEVSLWSYAMSRMGDFNTNDPMLQFIIGTNNKIPFVVADESMTIINYHLIPDKIISDKQLLAQQLQDLAMDNKPIEIPTWDNTYYIFYGKSAILKSLYYYPYIQLGIIVIFITFTYITLKSSKRDEQNRVWIGMAKETAHQLGTPTTSLLGWAEYLKTQPVEEGVVDEINKDLTRLLKIVDRFSKIGSETILTRANLDDVVAGTVTYFQTRIPRGVSINFHRSDGVAEGMINEALFEWVIENLFKNALDALAGRGQIVVSVTCDDKWNYIDVSDSGKGMAKSNFKRIFEPGFTTKTRGWGLGLSLSKRIIQEYHNGRIFVLHSEIDVGTTMRVKIAKC